jgi:hypothetical protein
MAGKLVLAIVCVCLLAACSHSPSSPTLAASPHVAQPSTSAASTAPAVTVGCGTYCQQAGDSAGTSPPGYPCPESGCRRCPPQNCVTLASSAATATNGVALVKLRCNLSTACRGAVLICLPQSTCWRGAVWAGRLAASDFVIPPGATRDVGVALTTLGKQIASGGGSDATTLVDLLNYGIVLNTTNSVTASFTLTSDDPPTLPPGTAAACGGDVFVGPNTSCPFAKNVEKAFRVARCSVLGGELGCAMDAATVTAFSPVTGRTYVMHCTSGPPLACRGGVNALVELYL